MPTTTLQETRWRRNVGDTTSSISTTVIDDYFDEALAVYPNGSDELLMAYAVVAGLEGLLAISVKRVTYQEGEASEDLTDERKGLENLLKYWRGKLDSLTDASTVAVNWGSLKKFPTRIKERPDA